MTACIVLGLLATPASSSATSSIPMSAGVALDTYSAPVSMAASRSTLGLQTPGDSGAECSYTRHRALAGALRFYGNALNRWREKMGASRASVAPHGSRCPRYLAKHLRARAHAARLAYGRYHEYHFHWQAWLPDKWARIGACETGYGRRPGDWGWNSGPYQGAFGFAVSSWDSFKYRADPKAGPYPSEAYLATPRQQYEVALATWRAYGFSGWGCKNA